MSGVDPEITLHQDGPLCYRATINYTSDTLDEMAHRVAERIENELVQQILERLGYVKPARCRDCKCFSVDQSDHEYRSDWWCSRWYTDMVEPDGYCAWGVRKEETE